MNRSLHNLLNLVSLIRSDNLNKCFPTPFTISMHLSSLPTTISSPNIYGYGSQPVTFNGIRCSIREGQICMLTSAHKAHKAQRNAFPHYTASCRSTPSNLWKCLWRSLDKHPTCAGKTQYTCSTPAVRLSPRNWNSSLFPA